MRRSAFALASFVLLNIQAAEAGVCISAHDIVSSEPNKNGTSILFKMRDGTAWQNDLRGPCPDLKFNGFSWNLRVNDRVCDRQESIRVIHSGEVCLLGAFKQVTTGPGSPH
jgi:hypothetical protein